MYGEAPLQWRHSYRKHVDKLLKSGQKYYLLSARFTHCHSKESNLFGLNFHPIQIMFCIISYTSLKPTKIWITTVMFPTLPQRSIVDYPLWNSAWYSPTLFCEKKSSLLLIIQQRYSFIVHSRALYIILFDFFLLTVFFSC